MFALRSPLMLSLAAASVITAGCAKDPSAAVPAAQVAPAAEKAAEPAAAEKPAEKAAEPAAAEPAAAAPAAAPTAAAPAAAEGMALQGDVLFTGSKVTAAHECKFTEWKGSFAAADGKAEGGSLRFEVQTGSVVADFKNPNDWSKKLEGHLKSEEFFHVEKFPTASFASSEIKAGGADGATHTVTGKLTIRGVTKDVSFPATITIDGPRVDAKAKFSINRKDFGIEYPGKADDLIRDGVVLEINVHS